MSEFQERWERAQAAVVPLEEALARKYQSVLAAHGREAVRIFEQAALTAAGEQRPLPGTVADELVPPEKFKASIRARTAALRKRIVNEVAAMLLGNLLLTRASDIPVYEAMIETLATAQAEYALEAQQDAVSSVILDAYQEGWSVPETADELRKVLKDYAPWQATRLARTDLISLANATSLTSAQSVEGGPRYKIWLSAQDDRVRETHVKANRQAVPLEQPFMVEGVPMMYPGDPSAPPELIMNCRCTQVYADTPNPVLRHSNSGGNEEGDELALAASLVFNEQLHPRHMKGDEHGGQFAPKGGTSSTEAQSEAYQAAQSKQEMERTQVHAEIGEVPTDSEELRRGLLESDLTDAQRDVWERAYRDGGGWWPRTTKDWSTAEGEKLREEMATAPVIAAAVDFTEGSMIALYPERPELLAQTDGQPAEDLHVTLAFLPNGYDGNTELLTNLLTGIALTAPVLEGQVGGVGYFTPGENGVPMIALPDVDGLAELRQSVVNALDVSRTTYATDHGFTAHITLTYVAVEDPETPDVIGIPLRFPSLAMVAGPERVEFPLEETLTSAATEAKVSTNGDEMSYEPQPDAPVAERVVALRSMLPESQIPEVLVAEDELFQPGLFEEVGATREEVIAMYAAASQSVLIPVDIPPTTITFSPQFLIQVPQQAPPSVTVVVPEQAPLPAPIIEVNVPPAEAPQITVEAPNVTVEAPRITVESPAINVPATIVNVPKGPAPRVEVTVPERDRKVKFKRDNRGQIVSAEIEED